MSIIIILSLEVVGKKGPKVYILGPHFSEGKIQIFTEIC